MAKKKPGSIDPAEFEKFPEAIRKQLQEEQLKFEQENKKLQKDTVSEMRKSFKTMDEKSVTALKDLTKAVSTNKKEFDKYSKGNDKKIDNVFKYLDKIAAKNDNQTKILEDLFDNQKDELKNLSKLFNKGFKQLEDKLDEVENRLEKDIEKVSAKGEKSEESSGIFGALGTAAGMAAFRATVLPVLAAAIAGSVANMLGKTIHNILKPIKEFFGYTQENFPQLYENLQQYNIHSEGGGKAITGAITDTIDSIMGKSAEQKAADEQIKKSIDTTRQQYPELNTGQSGASNHPEYVNQRGGGASAAGAPSGIPGARLNKVSNPVAAKQIYDYLREKGVDHVHAVGILSNLQNESKFNSGAIGDNGTSGGLFQHHNERFSAMVRAAGPDWQHNWKGQVDYALSESDMRAYLKRPVSSGEEAARAFVYDFERPKDKVGEASRRAGNVFAVEKLVSSSKEAPKQETPAAAPTSTENVTTAKTQAVSPTATHAEQTSSPAVLAPGFASPESTATTKSDSGQAIMSPSSTAAPKEERGKTSGGSFPSGDLVALGNALQKQGIKISEHPAFGGVKGKHAEHSAHYSGRAIDINAPGGIVEANDPVWGKKFDDLAAQIRAAGYKVIWRAAGHYNHLHAQIGGGNSSLYQGPEGKSGGGMEKSDTVGPSTSGFTPESSAPSGAPASPEPQTPMMPGMGAPSPMGMMGGPMGGMLGILAGMLPGGIGGMLMPMMGMLGNMLGGGMGGDMMNPMGMLGGQLGGIGDIANLMPPMMENPIANAPETSVGSAEGKMPQEGVNLNIMGGKQVADQSMDQNQMELTARPAWLGMFTGLLDGSGTSRRTHNYGHMPASYKFGSKIG